VMGVGAALTPRGEYRVALVGMPLLWPYAWIAFASICVTIYVPIRITGMTAGNGDSSDRRERRH
jgi:hypothetical protein